MAMGEGPVAKCDAMRKEACGQREEPRLREARGRRKHGGRAMRNWGKHKVVRGRGRAKQRW